MESFIIDRGVPLVTAGKSATDSCPPRCEFIKSDDLTIHSLDAEDV